MRLTHVRLLVSDFSRSFRFYHGTLGLEVLFSDESEIYAEFDAGNTAIAIFRKDLMAESVGTENLPLLAEIQDGIALILEVDDVDEAYAHLSSRDVKFITGPTNRPLWGIRTAHFRDPEGNLIEINGDLKPEAEEGK